MSGGAPRDPSRSPFVHHDSPRLARVATMPRRGFGATRRPIRGGGPDAGPHLWREVRGMAAEMMRVYAGRGAITQLVLGVVSGGTYGAALWATSFGPPHP